jgi:Ca2+-dependent lipid-binding protein
MESQKKLSEFTDEELVQEAKKKKKDSIYHALGIGFMVGVAFYSVVKNGLSFVTFAIIAFVVFIISKKPNDKAVQEEIKSRKSNQDDKPQG